MHSTETELICLDWVTADPLAVGRRASQVLASTAFALRAVGLCGSQAPSPFVVTLRLRVFNGKLSEELVNGRQLTRRLCASQTRAAMDAPYPSYVRNRRRARPLDESCRCSGHPDNVASRI